MKQIVTFVLLTFTITWSAQALIFLINTNGSVEISNENLFTLFLDILFLRVSQQEITIWAINSLSFGPTMAAFLTTALYQGRTGVRDLLRKVIDFKTDLHSLLLAFAIPVGMGGVALLIALVTSDFSLAGYEPILPWQYLLPFTLYMMFFTGLAEEVGWRGYLLSKLQQTHTLYKSSVIVGLIWGVWHIPYQIRLLIDQPVVLAFSLVGLIAGIIGWSIVVGWLYKKSANLPVIFLLHGWGNVITSYLITSSGSYTASVVYALLPWGIVYLLERTQREVLYGKE
jgi:membrane protease YdiL (CAAX protease family)